MADWLTKEQRSRNMAAIRGTGTTPERLLRGMLQELFPRRRIRERPDLPGKPDFFLPGLRLAVFADGCFWHGCPEHGRIPEDNRDYWEPKLAGNRRRDRGADRDLRARGLRPLRIWEHDLRHDPKKVRRRLRRVLAR